MNWKFPSHSQAIEKMTTKSVMSPLLWFVAIALVTLIFGLIFAGSAAQPILLTLIAVV
ncbi:hypothetical protein [Rhizobium sp. CF122]|uniref:hypothetical protein n=1 Tax=Rhizobium sp. CF122 TaxID=1144312 RepID=UPI0002EBFA58|nr:hypothetical protein [Rhizobium sp. CF122]